MIVTPWQRGYEEAVTRLGKGTPDAVHGDNSGHLGLRRGTKGTPRKGGHNTGVHVNNIGLP